MKLLFKLVLIYTILELVTGCTAMGTILQSAGQGGMHAHDNEYTCTPSGQNHYVCEK